MSDVKRWSVQVPHDLAVGLDAPRRGELQVAFDAVAAWRAALSEGTPDDE